MKYIVGVDAGGTRTTAVAYGLDGTRLMSASAGPGNVTAGGEPAAENILLAARGCAEAVDGQCLYAAVGMAGLDPEVTPDKIKVLLRRNLGAEADVLPDGELALHAAHGGDGLIVIAGTGSIAYGKRGGTVLRRGGWGHILGDRGSAYAIAADALRLALEDADSGRPEYELTRGLREALGLERLRSLVELVYGRPKAETAALATVVVAFSAQGDGRADGLLRRAGEELADMAVALSARLGLDAPPVAIAGGILENVPPVRQSFAARLAEALPQATVLTERVEPQRGALYCYRQWEEAHDR